MVLCYYDDRWVSDYWLKEALLRSKTKTNCNFNDCSQILHDYSHRYGDRYPSSALGRIFAVTWFLVGLTINALLVCALTSSTSTKVIETVQGKPGKLVGVTEDSPGDNFVNVFKRAGGAGKAKYILCVKHYKEKLLATYVALKNSNAWNNSLGPIV